MPRGDAANFKGKNKGTPGNKGRGTSQDRKDAAQIKSIARKLLMSPKAQATMRERMDAGTLHPSIVNTLFAYGWGRPADTATEAVKIVPVRVEHIYTDDSEGNARVK